MTPAPSPTPEQESILAADPRRNLMIRAYAGTGKTATLTMIDAVSPGPTLLLCFNKSVAIEAEKRVRPTTQVRTLNSLGHRVWSATCAHKVTLAPRKIGDIFRWLVDMEDRNTRSAYWAEYDTVLHGVDLARALGYIPDDHTKADRRLCSWNTLAKSLDERPSPLARTIIDRVLLESIRQAYQGSIDFGDQTYMPALFGGLYPRFPLVLIDEYQDLSPTNHAMVAKLCKSSRQIGVGDEAQAIYAFRGASNHSMGDAITRFDMAVLPLSVSFRCPSAIVANVHWRVPAFRALRDGGTVTHFDPTMPTVGAVICRNNAPLLALAMRALNSGVAVNVAGTDMGSKLLRLLSKLGPETLTSTQALDAVNNWEADRLFKDSKSAADLAECMRIFIRRGSTLDSAIAHARHIFSQSGTLHFLSGHKAKGLEWPEVYHLDSHLIRKDGQDPNVHYVIDTRSSDRLTYLESNNVN